MLNKINTLLASTSTTVIKEFKTTLYTFGNPAGSDTITLPAGITEGSLGLFLIGTTQVGDASTIVLGTPTGFTIIDKREGVNSGTSKGSSIGLFYKYMTAGDSSTTISTIFADSRGDTAEAVFVEVILNRAITTRGFGSLTAVAASAGGGAVTLTDVPSVIPNNDPFFILTVGTSSDGGISDSFTGGMEAYDTSATALNSTSRTVTDLHQYNDLRIQDLPDTADSIYTTSASGFGATGVFAIWLK